MAESSHGPAGKIVNYTYPADQHARWKQAADRKGQTLREWVRRALNEVADRQDAEHRRR